MFSSVAANNVMQQAGKEVGLVREAAHQCRKAILLDGESVKIQLHAQAVVVCGLFQVNFNFLHTCECAWRGQCLGFARHM